MQKYVAKPERRGLAEALGLTDAQVCKVYLRVRSQFNDAAAISYQFKK